MNGLAGRCKDGTFGTSIGLEMLDVSSSIVMFCMQKTDIYG